jgi:hypothetical protein
MFSWRYAIVLGGMFVGVGLLYWFLWYNFDAAGTDYLGATLLILLGIAMAFGFAVLLRGSREL